jgi:hypothetical protein
MSAEFYRVFHLFGLMLLFTGIGLVLAGGTARKFGMVSHGVGLLLMLVAGFGLLAKMQHGFQAWVIVKIVLWVGFAFIPVLAKKGVLATGAAWIAALVLGGTAAYLGVMKSLPFAG